MSLTSGIRPTYEWLLSLIYPNGFEWNLNGKDSIRLNSGIRQIDDTMKTPAWNFLMDALKPGDSFIDVGANWGIYTVAMAKRVGRNGYGYAFEPDAASFKTLMQHIQLNGVGDWVSLIPKAASDKLGSLRFIGGAGLDSHISFDETSGDTMKGTTLDVSIGTARVDVIKIDVQGFEMQVLTGARHLLERSVEAPKLLYVELHPWEWNKLGTTARDIYGYLTDRGYQIRNADFQKLDRINEELAIFAEKSRA